MKRFFTTVFCLFVLHISVVANAEELKVTVTSPYINVHSGPASEYPVFHVIAQGEQIEILKERTKWYKIRTVSHRNEDDEIEGWIYSDDLSATMLEDGVALMPREGSFEDFQNRDFEVSLMGGALDSTAAITLFGTWVWTKNLSVDASYTQALGNFSDNKIWSLRMRHTVFPEWKISPYLALGTGEIRTSPNANLVQSGDEVRVSSHYEVGLGVRYYLMDGVLIRAEYRSLIAETDRDEQERIDQWLVGASIYF
ncbi:SH3 domain-containing protein [Glaciecola sp. 1036]|uniref:SH3 domain-containing protein n=1 Tax=Alteromonadaceae TaxID=72275 RepID=UPI003D0320DC